MIEDDRRISTSSQTCYQQNEKILYPLRKTLKKVGEQRKEHFKKFSLNSEKTRLSEKKVLDFNQGQKPLKSPLFIPFLPDIKEKTFDFFGNHSPNKQRFTLINLKKNEKKGKLVKNLEKKKNLSAEIVDELFNENPKKVLQRKVREYSMHKTFYDIFLELSEKSKKFST
jgi:hypothetical protein